jgi:hypothetical protein
MGVNGQRHPPASLYPREWTPVTHCTTWSWVDLRAGLDTDATRKMLMPLPELELRPSNLYTDRATPAYEYGGIAPQTFSLGTRLRWKVSFTLWLLAHEESEQNPLNSCLGPRVCPDMGTNKNISAPLPGISIKNHNIRNDFQDLKVGRRLSCLKYHFHCCQQS